MTMSRGVERIHAALKWKESTTAPNTTHNTEPPSGKIHAALKWKGSTPAENKTDDDDHDNHAEDEEDDDDLDHDA